MISGNHGLAAGNKLLEYLAAGSRALLKSLRTLGQNLKCVLRSLLNSSEDFFDVGVWNIFVEQVTHGIDEIDRWLPALEWFIYTMWLQS